MWRTGHRLLTQIGQTLQAGTEVDAILEALSHTLTLPTGGRGNLTGQLPLARLLVGGQVVKVNVTV